MPFTLSPNDSPIRPEALTFSCIERYVRLEQRKLNRTYHIFDLFIHVGDLLLCLKIFLSVSTNSGQEVRTKQGQENSSNRANDDPDLVFTKEVTILSVRHKDLSRRPNDSMR